MSNANSLTTTFKKATLVKLLEDRVKEVSADFDRSMLEWGEAQTKAAKKQADFLRKKADRLETGKDAPTSSYDLRIPKDAEPPSKPYKKHCRAESLLKQVKASDQAHWRFDTDTYESIFGSACKV